MSAATTSGLLLPTVDSPPSSIQKPSADVASRKRLSIHPKTPPFVPLFLSLSSACQHHHDSFIKAAGLLRPLNNPLRGVAEVFKGFTHLFSSFMSNNPLFPVNNRYGGGGGRGGGETNHNFLSHFFCPPAIAIQDIRSQAWDSHDLPVNLVIHLDKLSRFKRYKVSNIKFLNPRTRSVIDGADEAFGDFVALKRGGVYTKHDLMEVLKSLSSSELFNKIDLDAKTNPDGSVDINIPFYEKIFPSKTKFKCIAFGSIPEEKPVENDPNMTGKERVEFVNRMNREYQNRLKSGRGCIVPDEMHKEIESMLVRQMGLSVSLLRRITRKIEKWYHDNSYYGAHVISTSNPELNQGGEITFEVLEGDIKKMNVKFVDKLGNICEGNTNIGVIKRALPEEVAVGHSYNRIAFEKAVQNLGSLDIFSNTEIIPEQDVKDGAFSVDIRLQEQPRTWSEVNTEWSIVPRRNGQRPTLASIVPGATISFGHRNIKGLNRSFQGAINLSNLFNPQDDIGFNFEYNHPYLDGVDDPSNRKLQATCFNTRKVSPVFRGGLGVDDTPILVDRVGVKANITEEYARHSKFTYGLVMEEIKTRGEGGEIVARGDTLSVNGQPIGNGPPTTLSSTGIDRMAFLQANLTRDNTRNVNGAIIGDRNVFQIDQGVGIGAFFNRHKLSATKFIPLKKVEEEQGKAPPPVLVLHGLYGGCVGDLPNHEAFSIGGPYSVRGYDMGEIGVSRYKLELAAEVRVPVKSAYAYAFAEHGNDLGSSVEVEGNPTKSYMRKGHGSSYGAGVKFREMRAEYAIDNNTRKGAFFIHYGDRF